MKLHSPWVDLTPLLACLAALLIAAAPLAAQEEKKAEPAPAAEAKAEEKAAEPAPASAEKAAEPAAEEKKEEAAAAPAPAFKADMTTYAIDNIVLFLCAVLVIFMQVGFALVETGLNHSKNAVNIMFKNYMDFCVGALLFFIIGFGIMYPATDATKTKTFVEGWLAFGGLGIPESTLGATAPSEAVAHPLQNYANFLFQVAFCATAATIVSGSVAGRIKFSAYLIYTAVISGILYPISGYWIWGGGWLTTMGFKDFAGSIVVHAVGGFAGLAGAIALGPRIGRFVNGKAVAMPGHNIPYAALGVFILVIGWYGFNPGSQLAFTDGINVDTVMLVAVNTTLACCIGAVAAMAFSWAVFKKPDLTLALNGGLAGLVGITANCNVVTNLESLVIGGVAGVLVCIACIALDKLQIDDPVGAFPVHGVCGVWGGIATGIFGDPAMAVYPQYPLTLTTQLVGVGAVVAWALGVSLALFFALKAVGLLRVHAEEEIAGLDISEHGMYAYPQQVVALENSPTSYGSGGGHGGSPAVAAKPSTQSA